MKHTPHILLVAAALIANVHAVAPGAMPVLASRVAKVNAVEAAQKAVVDLDAQYTAILGEDWHDRLMKSTLTEGEEMAAVYVKGPHFDYPWNTVNDKACSTLVAHLLAKPVLDANDLKLVTLIGHRVIPRLEPRAAEILALSNPLTLEYYRIKYVFLSGGNSNAAVWLKSVTPSEWLTLASGDYDANTYALIQSRLLALATGAMVEKRKAANEDTDGPEFDAAMAPIVAALNAPLFNGLTEAVQGLGIDLKFPDLTPTVTRANRLAASIERRTVTAAVAGKTMGSVMFVKGVTDYNSWASKLATP